MLCDDEFMYYMGKAIRKGVKCWVSVKPQDLIDMDYKKLCDMIVKSSNLKKDLESGSKDVESMIKDLKFQIKLLDNAISYRFMIDRELGEAELEAARVADIWEEDTDIRKEMLEKLNRDLEKLPTEKIERIILSIDEL